MGVVTPLRWLVLLMAKTADASAQDVETKNIKELYATDPDARKIAKLYNDFYKRISLDDVHEYNSQPSNDTKYDLKPGQNMDIIKTIQTNDSNMDTSESGFAPRRPKLRFT